MSAPLDGVLERLRSADCSPTQSGSEWKARCPAHDDRNPSLSIKEGSDGRVLLHCFAGCSTDAVCSALGMKTADLFDPSTRRNGTRPKGAFDTPDEVVAFLRSKRGEPTAVWNYTDAKGRLVGLALRFDDPSEDGGKIVLPVSLLPGGWMVKAMLEPRPLYRLPELTEAERVIVCEGEKAADAARSLGLTATTSAGGCKAPAKADWSPLAGKDVVLIPDNDGAGRTYVERITAMISVLDPRPTMRIVNLPDVPDSGDIVEFIAARDGCIELARHDLDDLIEHAQPLTAVDLTRIVDSAASGLADDWPSPVSVPSPLPAVEAFDPALLPAVFMPWITDIAERMQCPPDFPAVSAMIAAAGVIGRKVGIRPKKRDDWLVVPNLWGVLIGRPSMMKTPPLKEVMRPVKALIKAADHEHEQAMKAHRDRGQELDLRKAALESRVKSKLRKSDEAAEEIAELLGITEDMAEELPPRKRYVVNDATVQALSEVLAENPNGVTLVRDELIGFLKSLDMESQQAARAFYLEAWDGTGSYESDRIGRGNTRVEAVCLSMVGTCQPGPLSEYLKQAITGGLGDDGLMQRFQLAVWPDDPGPWVNIDRVPNSDARNAAFAVYDRLDTLTPESVGAERDELDLDGIPYLRFDDAAYDRFIAWMTERENRLRDGNEPPAIESHMVKYRSLIPSIAMVSHLVDGGVGPVTLEALDRAIGWGDYLETHSRRIYAQGIEPELPAARALAQKILDRKLASGFVVRDVYRPRWSRLATKEDATAAVECLIELDWLRQEYVNTRGAPKMVHEINPAVFAPDFEPFAPD
jgi:hypothetical protein